QRARCVGAPARGAPMIASSVDRAYPVERAYADRPGGDRAASPAGAETVAPSRRAPPGPVAATTEPAWIRRLIIGVAVCFVGLFVLVPLAAVFGEAFRNGVAAFAHA